MTQLATKPMRHVPERRAYTRTPVACPSAVRRDGQPFEAADIIDVAREGCALRFDGELTPHQSVEVAIAGLGPVHGRIIWRSDSSYGCRFEAPLPSGAITGLFLAADKDMAPVAASASRARHAKFSPIAALAILGGVTLSTWAGLAGVVLHLA